MSHTPNQLNDHILLLYPFDDPDRGEKVRRKVYDQSTLALLDIIAEASLRHDADGQVEKLLAENE